MEQTAINEQMMDIDVPNMQNNYEQNRNAHDIARAADGYSQSQKGAIIIALLGAEHARPLVELFEDKHLQSFVTAMQTIQFIERPILLATIAEFINSMRENNQGLRGGEASARALAEALLSTERAKQFFGSPDQNIDADNAIWASLKNEKAERLAEYLNGQRPELVSFVLSKMDSVKAGEILAELSDFTAEAAASQMSLGADYDADIETAITELMRIEFLESAEVDNGTQTASFMADVMGVLPKARRDRLMEIISKDNPDTADKIKRGLLTFEDLPKRLPKTAIPLIFRDMDTKGLLAALKSGQEAEPDTVDFLFANISQRMAEQYKEQVDELGALSEKESEVAIIALMSFISRHEKSGKISYIDIEEAEA